MPGPPPLMQASAVAAVSASVSGGGMAPPPPYLTPPLHDILTHPSILTQNPEALLHYTFPSEADTLAYVDALKHSDLSDWRSLQEVAARAGGGSCSGAVTTSVLTALYLLGLFNLCAASPASCCVPPASSRRRRRRTVDATLPPLLNNLQHNLSSLSLEQFQDLPHVTTEDGGRIPLHISVVDQVRKLWDSNPRLLSSVSCSTATQSVRSSFISLSGVASGIILAYSVAQLTQCYPDHTPDKHIPPKIWFFPIPNKMEPAIYPVPIIPSEIPVKGDDEDDDGCERSEVPLGPDKCAPLLSSEFCPYKHWVLLNKETGMGECVPRLCSDNFVYVESDQMCHDINEPGICPGNRRLYLTASGNAVCDCPEGMFPGPQDICYYLHESAYCYKDSVLQFNKPSKTLICKLDPCGHVNENLWPDDLPYAPNSKDGYCYQFNEQGPCKKGQRFGFDTDELEATCVSLEEAGLVRPRRSYMFQQITYPATQDHQYPHYQVSYIIMNGTTWDLEVKGIGRNRRDTSSRSRASSSRIFHSEKVVPFIDTREMPRNLYPFLKPRIPRWVTNKRNRRGSSRSSQRNSNSQSHRGGLELIHKSGNQSEANQHTDLDNKVANDDEDEPAISIHISMTPLVSGNTQDSLQSSRRSSKRNSQQNGKNKKDNVFEIEPEGNDNTDVITGQLETNQESGKMLPRTTLEKLDSREVIKVEQSGDSEPIIVRQTPPSHQETKGRGKKKERRRNRNSRRRGRKKKDRNRDRGRRRRKKRPNKGKNATKADRKRKNPKLPFRVPTVMPPTDAVAGMTPTNTRDSVPGAEESEESSRSEASDNERKNIRGSDSSGSASSTKVEQGGGTVITKPHRISATDTGDSGTGDDDSEEKENQQTSSSESSLPKYLRHRGRRQLVEGGGIIQAPLLSACKPGAKRDYNYKCRPKFIPQERDRRGARNTASNEAAPRQPRISCPEGTRLDPRGKCQQVS
ncbi:hypothetical protein SK128_026229 [Halocaridina rubra]|uniref:DUF4789 domain-containing protein n=1 Tax=Halocaridina rubra TaxID=373956 RepID=A0AAN8WPK4_HALRR